MPIEIEMLILEESPYFSYYLCKILGPRDVALLLKDTHKCSELLESVVTTISELSLHSACKF